MYILLLILSFSCFAETLTYEGVATIKGKTIYIEKHRVELNSKGQVLESETKYTDPSGTLLGVLKNDYRKVINIPDHEMHDIRKKTKHGTRLKGEQIELFSQDEGEKEETKVIKNKVDKGLIVASQGLHYYLISHFEEMKVKKFPLKFLIPGKLDSYTFILSYLGKTKDGLDEFEVEIDNWFLRLFAPSLILKYHPDTKHLIYYKGLSNLASEKGEMMSVEINYSY